MYSMCGLLCGQMKVLENHIIGLGVVVTEVRKRVEQTCALSPRYSDSFVTIINATIYGGP